MLVETENEPTLRVIEWRYWVRVFSKTSYARGHPALDYK